MTAAKIFKHSLLLGSLFFWIGVTHAPCTAENRLTAAAGTFLGIESGAISIETSPGVVLHAPLDPAMRVVSDSGPYALLWLLPGDGIKLQFNHAGGVIQIKPFVSWAFGTVAFTSDRLTLLEGPQFFVEKAPVSLNGQSISSLGLLQPPNEVLVRLDTLDKKTAGVWGFDRDRFKEENGSLQNDSWITATRSHGILRIGVKSQPGGKMFAELLGVTRKFLLPERQPGHYGASLFIPAGVAMPRSYLQLEWTGKIDGQTESERWIHPKPIFIYTQKPLLSRVAPPDGSTVPVNPPFIFASFDPRKPPLDLNSVRLLVDRKNKTPDCYINSYLVFFSPPYLPRGKHQCILSGRTLGGEGAFRFAWSFNVKS